MMAMSDIDADVNTDSPDSGAPELHSLCSAEYSYVLPVAHRKGDKEVEKKMKMKKGKTSKNNILSISFSFFFLF